MRKAVSILGGNSRAGFVGDYLINTKRQEILQVTQSTWGHAHLEVKDMITGRESLLDVGSPIYVPDGHYIIVRDPKKGVTHLGVPQRFYGLAIKSIFLPSKT